MRQDSCNRRSWKLTWISTDAVFWKEIHFQNHHLLVSKLTFGRCKYKGSAIMKAEAEASRSWSQCHSSIIKTQGRPPKSQLFNYRLQKTKSKKHLTPNLTLQKRLVSIVLNSPDWTIQTSSNNYLPKWFTPQKSNIDTKHGRTLEEPPFTNHHFGYPR